MREKYEKVENAVDDFLLRLVASDYSAALIVVAVVVFSAALLVV